MLAFDSGVWSGSVSLASAAVGSQTVTVTATDTQGGMGSASTNFLYDPAPILSVTSPSHDQAVVTGSSFVVAATCSDGLGLPCSSLVVSMGDGQTSQEVASGTGAVNQSVPTSDFPSYNQAILTYVGTDAAGHSTTTKYTVWYESGSGLAVAQVVNGQLLDFSLSELLYIDDASHLHILNRVTGADQQLPDITGSWQPYAGLLTSNGCVVQSVGGVGCETFEWNGNSVLDVGGCSLDPRELVVFGSLAVWADGNGGLILRDVGDDFSLDVGAHGAINARAKAVKFNGAGDLFFTAASPQNYPSSAIFERLGDGGVMQLTFPAYQVDDSNLQVNGNDLVYVEGNFLYDLTDAGTLELASGPNAVLANSGWVAWTQSTVTSTPKGGSFWYTVDWQLLLRSPAGDQQTLTTGSTSDWWIPAPDITPDALASTGVLLTGPGSSRSNGGQLWIDGGSQLVWDGWGVPQSRGAALYVMHHDTLFCIVDQDSGTPLCPDFDAGLWNGGALDDAGQDAGSDGGITDAGSDAGAVDGGRDGGHLDGGPSDAGEPDAGQALDAGATHDGGDAGGATSSGSTGGTTSGPPPTSRAGGCASAPGEPDFGEWLLVILGAALAIKRNRSRPRDPWATPRRPQ
jgi:hypothetical protein